ncbi:MAG TPA: hypothetical protein PKH05_05510 [Nitrospira sp.]|nr:hypothetical protein [Nitrospira sp.]HNL88499.1 hypothetical protein [Nitrospira sp.]HNO33725.1 hypothetical protein [Nitrospira sp.]
MSLSTHLLLDLIALFERSATPQSVREGSPLPGVPGSEVFCMTGIGEDQRTVWLNRIGDAAAISISTDDGPVVVEIEDGDNGAYYRCPITFRQRLLTDNQAGLFAVDEPVFLNHLADLLAIPQAFRRGIGNPAIDGKLWCLGKARVGTLHTDVWVVRDLHGSYDEIFRYLSDPNQPDQGVVLTTSTGLPGRLERPRRYCFVSLADVLCEVAGKAAIDGQMIFRCMTSPAGADMRPSLPVEYDELSGVLRINGKEPWTIEGPTQRGIVRQLYDAYCKGHEAVKAGVLLKAVGCGGEQHGKSKKMQDVFSGNPKWKHYLHAPEHGMYAFKLD